MQFDKVIIFIAGIGGIFFTYWFFLMKKDTVVTVKNAVDIIVDGGYSPSTISIPQGKKTTINFFRKDPSSCLEEVVLPDFKIRKYLPLNQTVSVELTPKKTGTYDIVCGMNMFHGKVIVS